MNKPSNTYQLPKTWSKVNFEDIVVFTMSKKPSLFKQENYQTFFISIIYTNI